MFLATMVHNVLYRPIKEKIAFLHVPKCGGQSLNAAIKRHFPLKNMHINSIASLDAAAMSYNLDYPVVDKYEDVLKFREHLLLYFMNNHKDVSYIRGHFHFSEKAYQSFHQKYYFITLLRHPVKRWISNYFFHRYKKEDSDYVKIEEDLPEFLRTKRAQQDGQRLVQMIGGFDVSGNYASQQAIEHAKENLHKFEVIGVLEYLDDFLTQFQKRFGARLRFPKKNVNPKSKSFIQAVITQEIEREIARICQPDLEVYRYAVENFVCNYDSMSIT